MEAEADAAAPWEAVAHVIDWRATDGTCGRAGEERVFGDAAARFALGALPGPYLPWGSGAMRPAGLVVVCNDIVLNERRRIVELGSGVSTVLLARLLAQGSTAGARLAAIEHDARWARWVAGQLAREGVGDDVVVVEAPLRPSRLPTSSWGGTTRPRSPQGSTRRSAASPSTC